MPTTTTRHYTAKELNQLLTETRAPTLNHHPTIGLLLAMALVLENIYVLNVEEDVEWMAKVVPILSRELLRGTACVLEHGVAVKAVH